MTKEDSILHVVQAFKDGKTIQACNKGWSDWCDNKSPSWNFMEVEYRVKPEVVEVVRYAILDSASSSVIGYTLTRRAAEIMTQSYGRNVVIVELRGSYEKE